jgi:hypothetical protein
MTPRRERMNAAMHAYFDKSRHTTLISQGLKGSSHLGLIWHHLYAIPTRQYHATIAIGMMPSVQDMDQ